MKNKMLILVLLLLVGVFNFEFTESQRAFALDPAAAAAVGKNVSTICNL
jgi:hypothetical protein